MATKATPGPLNLQKQVMDHKEESQPTEQELHTTAPSHEINISDSTN